MARIAGVDLPRDKRVVISLTYIFGVGPTMSKMILEQAGVDENARTRDLSDDDLHKIREIIDNEVKVEGDLRREVQANVKRKIEIGSYQGRRHRAGLPVRGQRTHTNARTRKGPKKTVAGSKKVRAKK